MEGTTFTLQYQGCFYSLFEYPIAYKFFNCTYRALSINTHYKTI